VSSCGNPYLKAKVEDLTEGVPEKDSEDHATGRRHPFQLKPLPRIIFSDGCGDASSHWCGDALCQLREMRKIDGLGQFFGPKPPCLTPSCGLSYASQTNLVRP